MIVQDKRGFFVIWGYDMYQIGEKVVYGIHGVCLVTDQEERRIDKKYVTYLVLEPVGQEGAKYYVPTHNAAAMAKLRGMLSAEELEALIRSAAIKEEAWIRDENQRKQIYRELISSGDREKLIGMVASLYRHREQQSAVGKKIHMCDENFLRDAEKLLAGEISVVMGLEQDQAKQYLRNKLKEDA